VRTCVIRTCDALMETAVMLSGARMTITVRMIYSRDCGGIGDENDEICGDVGRVKGDVERRKERPTAMAEGKTSPCHAYRSFEKNYYIPWRTQNRVPRTSKH
jgi:hypothetical protein